MELRQYLNIARRWWWLAVLAMAVAGSAAYFVSSSRTPVYEAEATLLVNRGQNPNSPTYEDVLSSQQLVKTYAQMIESRPVLEEARGRLPDGVSLSDLEAGVDGSAIEDTQLLRLTYEDTDPDRAADVANEVARVFVGRVRVAQLGDEADEDASEKPINTVFLAEPAVAPDSPVSPQPERDAVLAAIVGLVVAAGIALLIEYMDDTVKHADDLEQLGIASLGTVQEVRGKQPEGHWAANILDDDQSVRPVAEDFWVVRANLEFAIAATNAKVIEVVSAEPQEGKTTTTCDVAVALAESGRRVLVVDCDLRKPSVHRFFELPNSVGVSTLFLDSTLSPGRAVRPTRIENLFVLPSGPLPPNPAELLSSQRMMAVIRALAEQCDIVLLDTPPLRNMADATLLAPTTDAFLLVIRSGRHRPGAVAESREAIMRTGRPLLGAVLNRERSRRKLGEYERSYYAQGRLSAAAKRDARSTADSSRF
ncbi:MAG TPA: polysaccharide biosynthesis tyrosine autokinase [Dehalococcoidia bacterium]|nr:polysaccharide biosynthesis tyrosine autokinase [Dehalococcoidia bacterium]